MKRKCKPVYPVKAKAIAPSPSLQITEPQYKPGQYVLVTVPICGLWVKAVGKITAIASPNANVDGEAREMPYTPPGTVQIEYRAKRPSKHLVGDLHRQWWDESQKADKGIVSGTMQCPIALIAPWTGSPDDLPEFEPERQQLTLRDYDRSQYPTLEPTTTEDAIAPFIKWAGGKRSLISRLQPIWEPHRDRRLVDLTCGSGAIALGLRPKQALLNDCNPHLINLFKQVQQGFSLDGFDVTNTQEAYLEKRDRFNALIKAGEQHNRESAQLFYYLLKHCFNGLCRFNQQGLFNVGWGKYKSVSLVKDWGVYRDAIAPYEFSSGDFCLEWLSPDDFVFADPPYDTEQGFTGYYGSFNWSDQVRLADCLTKHPGPVVAFNAATDRIIDLYQDRGFTVSPYDERRSISCDGDRTSAPCVLITRNLDKPVVVAPWHDAVVRLEQERDRLLREGVAPDYAAIEVGKVSGKKTRQVYWRATKPIFQPKRSTNVEALVRRQYIGVEGGKEHQEAIGLVARRTRLRQVLKQLELLEEQTCKSAL